MTSMWGYYRASSFNVDNAGNDILWINAYVESPLGNSPFKDDHYLLITTCDRSGNGFQVAISQRNGIKSRYKVSQEAWVEWV